MNIRYPIFTNFTKYTLERYWHDLLDQCSKGSLPKGIRFDIRTNSLLIESTKETFILPKDDIIGWRMCYQVFKKMGLGPPSSIEIPKPLEHIIENSWKKIRSKHSRDTLILKYVLSLCKKYNLKPSETKQLLTLLHLALTLNTITPQSIIMNDGNITRIDGLTFNREKRLFNYPLSIKTDKTKITSRTRQTKKNKIELEMDRYIRHMSNVNKQEVTVM